MQNELFNLYFLKFPISCTIYQRAFETWWKTSFSDVFHCAQLHCFQSFELSDWFRKIRFSRVFSSKIYCMLRILEYPWKSLWKIPSDTYSLSITYSYCRPGEKFINQATPKSLLFFLYVKLTAEKRTQQNNIHEFYSCRRFK